MKSKEVSVQSFTQPLEQAVHPLFSMLNGPGYSEQQQKEMIQSLLLILEAVSFEMLSDDKWFFVINRAAKNAKEQGIEDFEKYAKAILEMRNKISPTNPISGMF